MPNVRVDTPVRRSCEDAACIGANPSCAGPGALARRRAIFRCLQPSIRNTSQGSRRLSHAVGITRGPFSENDRLAESPDAHIRPSPPSRESGAQLVPGYSLDVSRIHIRPVCSGQPARVGYSPSTCRRNPAKSPADAQTTNSPRWSPYGRLSRNARGESTGIAPLSSSRCASPVTSVACADAAAAIR
jgi:hypothetical protein